MKAKMGLKGASACIMLLAIIMLASACGPQIIDPKEGRHIVQAAVSTPTLEPWAFLPLILKKCSYPTGWAENRSYSTTCKEEDNINVSLFGSRVDRFRIVATHPTYEVGVDNCDPNFSGCPTPTPGPTPPPDVCSVIHDDGINVVRVCTMSEWWRPYSMTVVVPDRTAGAHYLELYRKIQGANEWPGFMVLYEDGNMRLIPHPPMGRSKVCYGSSVIIGPAVPAVRPYVDIQEVRVTPTPLSLDIAYRNGGTSHLDISVDRNQAVVEVQVNYDLTNPFVTFRSMWVKDGNADVDHIQNQDGDFPILGDWTCLRGPWWFFHRTVRSDHNTSAPDIRIEVLD